MSITNRDERHGFGGQRGGVGESFETVVERRLSRRAFLQGAAASTVILAARQPHAAQAAEQAMLRFEGIGPRPTDEDALVVPEGYRTAVLVRWGDPIVPGGPAFDPQNQSAAAQAEQFGYNNDFVAFLPLPFGSNVSDYGLLVVNHEYTNPELMFPDYDPEEPKPTLEQVDIQLAAHGMSVVEIARQNGAWTLGGATGFSRRITGTTPMLLSGPAVGHEWLKTAADPSGTLVLGTLANCAGGTTPWGTVVSAEEDFNSYFGNTAAVPESDPRRAVHDRYGMEEETSEYLWEQFYERFDVGKEPNEAFRFGWAVEIDPYDPSWQPRKRTALGRTIHEAQQFVVAPDGRVVAYCSDDDKFEYTYKFITAGTFNPTDRLANRDLLDAGTLYVARFDDDGGGAWLPLVWGAGPLTAENGFASQADVLLKTRLAADAVGATKMDRPEDLGVNPANKKIYMVMTKNADRGLVDMPATDAANPRPENKDGHIIEVTEAGDDHAALSFRWEIFLLCGNPSDESTYFAGFPREQVSPIACPDNITFDNLGNLWIATDGAPDAIEFNDGLFAVPVAGGERGMVRQFFSTVAGSEVCGPEFTPDNATLFIAVQHPGEDGTWAEPISNWPDGQQPVRPSIIVVQADDGGPVGVAMPQGAAAQPQLTLAEAAVAGVATFFGRRERLGGSAE